MTLTFLGHSTYLVDTGESYLLFDYYKDFAGCPPVASLLERDGDPLYIVCTHSHGDHYSHKVFDLPIRGRRVKYIFHTEVASVVPDEHLEDVLFVSTAEHFEIDERVSGRAYGSTDIGGSFYVEVKDPSAPRPVKLFHAGDLNNWHWNEEADAHYIGLYEGAYADGLKLFGEFPIAPDLVMFPTDYRLGKDYLKGLSQFLEVTSCRYVAPMHLNGSPREDERLDALCDRHGITLLFPFREGIKYSFTAEV